MNKNLKKGVIAVAFLGGGILFIKYVLPFLRLNNNNDDVDLLNYEPDEFIVTKSDGTLSDEAQIYTSPYSELFNPYLNAPDRDPENRGSRFDINVVQTANTGYGGVQKPSRGRDIGGNELGGKFGL